MSIIPDAGLRSREPALVALGALRLANGGVSHVFADRLGVDLGSDGDKRVVGLGESHMDSDAARVVGLGPSSSWGHARDFNVSEDLSKSETISLASGDFNGYSKSHG